MTSAKVAIGSVTAVLLVSQAGAVLLPALIPLHIWAARQSGGSGRVGWALVAGLAAAVPAWAITYVTIGERQPFIWLVPLGAAAAVAYLVRRA